MPSSYRSPAPCACLPVSPVAVRTARTRNEQGPRRSFSKNLIRTPTCTYTPARGLCTSHCADHLCIATALGTHQLVYPFPVCVCAGQTSSRPTCAQNWSVSSLHCQVYEKAVLTCVFATIRQSGPVLGHRSTARRAGHTHRTRRRTRSRATPPREGLHRPGRQLDSGSVPSAHAA